MNGNNNWNITVNYISNDINNSIVYYSRYWRGGVKLTQRQIDLLLESVAYHQLHLQKLYIEQNDKNIKDQLVCHHDELCEISKMLVKELDNMNRRNNGRSR